jgi:hypothetical protein
MIPRAQVIEKSLSCFGYGLLTWIPAVGLFLAPVALWRFRFVVLETNDRWNPARRHLYGGLFLALASVLVHAVLAVILYLKVIRYIANE